jgi:6-pyruvoyltetrahydropterin/6-carboxytetrahydropterin synthase
MIIAERYHDISAGHRVVGHESHCKNLHGHNYRFRLMCTADDQLDDLGRVIDFSEIKNRVCSWLDAQWDHKFLVWEEDPLRAALLKIDSMVVTVPFNPTAENLAKYLVEEIGPNVLEGTGVFLLSCVVEETRKCCATYTLNRRT